MTLKKREQQAILQSLKQNTSAKITSTSLLESYTKVVSLANSLQIVLIALFGLLGAMAAPIAFNSNDQQQLNIFWLLLILLGTHFLSLFIWLIGCLKRTNVSANHHWFNVLLSKLGRTMRLPKEVIEAFLTLRFGSSAGTWGVARLLHCCWTSYLLGGLLSAVLFLMTHQVHFIWETTLLTQQDFHSLTQSISTLPSWLGFPAPSAADIAFSQVGIDQQPEDTRKTWAIWILACVFIYGVLLRLMLAVLSHILYHQKRTAVWHSYTSNKPLTAKVSSQIVDPAPTNQSDSQIVPHRPLESAEQRSTTLDQICYLFEWSKSVPTDALNGCNAASLNNAEQQQAYLQHPSDHRAIIIDADISPDRGSLRFLRQANATTESFYLHGNAFVQVWNQALQERAIAPHKIIHLKD